MINDIQLQIDEWTRKRDDYSNKELIIKQSIAHMEAQRQSINKLPVGSPVADRFYRRLHSLYTQLSTLPAKIRHCQDNILTLKTELPWS